MEKNNKNLIIAGIAIIVVIAIAIIVPHLKKASAPAVPATDSAMSADTDTTSAATSASAGQAAWNAVIKQYTGKLVMFGSDCSATPNDQVQALGTKVLLVNNGTTAHTVGFGKTTYTIGAQHYKTATVDTSSVIVISCDTNEKAATITVK